jgi:hypothetical protein
MKIIIFLILANAVSAKNIVLQSTDLQTQVIELFSSQGCSSCPPADAWLSSLKNNKGLWSDFIPIAMHVDYWDSLGWKDKFAHKNNTARQQLHKMFGNLPSLYTPGVLKAGKEWRAWRFAAIVKSPNKVGKLTFSLKGEKLTAAFSASIQEKHTLKVALLGMGLNTYIQAGENNGKRLKHDFVLLNQQSFFSTNGQWHETLLHSFFSAPYQNLALVVWVESDTNPAPIQAVGMYL